MKAHAEVKGYWEPTGNDQDLITEEVGALNTIFSRELTPEISEWYLNSLVSHLGGIEQSWEAFVAKGEALHKYVGDNLYGPLIVGCVNWVARKCSQIGYQGPVYFLLRDAAPLEAAASILWKDNGLIPHMVYANRPILGIEDEISQDASSQNFVKGLEYLKQQGIYPNGKSVIIDSGAWGTVIKLLKTTSLKNAQLYPFFWYTHNTHIPGYLNRFLEESGLPEKALETINDSLECVFPQPWQRPVKVEETGNGLKPVLVPSTTLAVRWGMAAIEGVKHAAKRLQGIVPVHEEINCLKMLAQLSDQANRNGEWTGVLPVNTPTWSQGEQFLADWPEGLLP